MSTCTFCFTPVLLILDVPVSLDYVFIWDPSHSSKNRLCNGLTPSLRATLPTGIPLFWHNRVWQRPGMPVYSERSSTSDQGHGLESYNVHLALTFSAHSYHSSSQEHFRTFIFSSAFYSEIQMNGLRWWMFLHCQKCVMWQRHHA